MSRKFAIPKTVSAWIGKEDFSMSEGVVIIEEILPDEDEAIIGLILKQNDDTASATVYFTPGEFKEFIRLLREFAGESLTPRPQPEFKLLGGR